MESKITILSGTMTVVFGEGIVFNLAINNIFGNIGLAKNNIFCE